MNNEHQMLNNQLVLVKEFLEEWLDFADNGSKESNKWVNPQFGLCFNLRIWAHYYQVSFSYLEETFDGLLKESFPNNSAYPFGGALYFFEQDGCSHHKNQGRLAWVRETISKLGEDLSEESKK